MPKQHESVLEREVIQNLNLLGGSLIVDGTLGDGGHAELLLKNTTGFVIENRKDTGNGA